MTEQNPRILIHPTTSGLWLTPETPEGRALIERVPPRPAFVVPDASGQPSWGAMWYLPTSLGVGAVFLGVIAVVTRTPILYVMAGMCVVVLGILVWGMHKARQDWDEMGASGVAVPVPLEWLNSTQVRRMSRGGRTSRAELVSVPQVEGVPGLVWAWKVGQTHAAVTKERLPD